MSFQVLIGPSRYAQESTIFDKLKHQKRFFEVLFVLRLSSIACRFLAEL